MVFCVYVSHKHDKMSMIYHLEFIRFYFISDHKLSYKPLPKRCFSSRNLRLSIEVEETTEVGSLFYGQQS